MSSKDRLLDNLVTKRYQDETGEEALRALNEKLLLMEEKAKIADEFVEQLVAEASQY